MFDAQFEAQARLLIQCLPQVAKHGCFALKGGTAINLFLRDMPRMSVDIDLTYLPLRPRDKSLRDISAALLEVKGDVERLVMGSRVVERRIQGHVAKLSVASGNAAITIKPNLVLRGSLVDPVNRELSRVAQTHFAASATIQTLAQEELYGGKLCDALDRQHPRDLFDVRVLLAEEGITPAIRRAFVVNLASHSRPMHELLAPNLIDITGTFERQFIGMTREPVAVDELVATRQELIERLVPALDAAERRFLLSLKSGDPEWALLGIEGLERMPALQWKLLNIRKMEARKRDEQLRILQGLLRAG